ncbi:MAG: ATP-dependent zinc metalloprotease FtsH [Lachnospiraceae bacterium]|nr:ATP-dependent zinc metalloprotease FtsH [Lachnospiraceae bacterium]
MGDRHGGVNVDNKDYQNRNEKPEENGNRNQNWRMIIICLISAMVIFVLYSYMSSLVKKSTYREISYTEFVQMVEKDQVEKVVFLTDRLEIEPKSGTDLVKITYYTGYLAGDEAIYGKLDAHGVTYSKKVEENNAVLQFIVLNILPLVLLWGAMYFIFRNISRSAGGMMGVGKSNAKMYMQADTGVTFADVAGQEEAKESLVEIIDFLHNPERYLRIGAKCPKGALLIGPPGTGKTLLAKAVAGEAKVPFFSLSGSGFVEMFVGVGASRVRDLFKQAEQTAPCIIFIDEIDAIGKSRDSQFGNDEREQTLNQLLSEMDGFDTSKGIVILAATNRPEVLDKALLRPGRFDRRIIVDKPDLKGRVAILKVHSKNVLMHDSVDLEAIGLATSGAVGSDLANIVNEAAILAVKKGRTVVKQEDLLESVEVVIAGKEKKDRILSPAEKKIVAYHEVGHALITALEKNAEPVQKITIVPRTMGALGYVMQVPEEERYLMTEAELRARLVTLFGGRAAEELVFDSITTGASNDIEQATALARAMITQYGMSKKFGLMGLESVQNRYLDGRPVLNCGDETAAEIDHEVMDLLKECYERAKELLSGNLDILAAIADYLYEKETITGKEFMDILRKVRGENEAKAEAETEGEAQPEEAAEPAETEKAEAEADGEESEEEPEEEETDTDGEDAVAPREYFNILGLEDH